MKSITTGLLLTLMVLTLSGEIGSWRRLHAAAITLPTGNQGVAANSPVEVRRFGLSQAGTLAASTTMATITFNMVRKVLEM